MNIEVDIWDFDDEDIVDCIVTRIENGDLHTKFIEEIKEALKYSQEETYLPEAPEDFEDFVHQMERDDFETLFELMKASWQNS